MSQLIREQPATVRVRIEMPPSEYAMLKEAAANLDLSLAQLCRRAVRREIALTKARASVDVLEKDRLNRLYAWADCALAVIESVEP
ncbi:hypothetical protein [Paraburkholderia caribensis]|uniref:hypothetical protein n=1 Tax=Paraburkholderia caribensis TaxID=75105 RepID=UPI0020914F84|nr:hypothetical protein [Paraburkholderia caribensis]MCO4880258.1 hypothetical protein [Paraburkholderia caribensis]